VLKWIFQRFMLWVRKIICFYPLFDW
jgi:hypothetical protein